MLRVDGKDVAGPWPEAFPAEGDSVEEGLVVYGRDNDPVYGRFPPIEGRTTGSRRPCISIGCPGWFIGVRWETGQLMHICSEGWRYFPDERVVRVVDGGEISARWVSPEPAGTPPLPREAWPVKGSLRGKGWRTRQ